MRTIALRLVLGAGMVMGLAACSDALVEPQPNAAARRIEAPAQVSLDGTITTEYRSYSCYYERGGRIYEDRETWARDTDSGPPVVHGEPYFVSFETIDNGPTAGIGWMPCDYYPGYW